MKSHITTKTGDAGTTRTLSGDIESKAHPILECTGWIDTLRAQLALIRRRILIEKPESWQEIGDVLFWLIHCCFLIGTQVNDAKKKHPEYRWGEISDTFIEKLEHEQQWLEGLIELPRAFIVSAATELSAQVDVSTTFARTFERSLVRLKEAEPEFDAEKLLIFSNRLSDYLFILARYLDRGDYEVLDYTRLNGH